jgi:hypothetical protein
MCDTSNNPRKRGRVEKENKEKKPREKKKAKELTELWT